MLIGELAERCGVSARMLRHYDRIGLVSPTERTSGGYREYSPEDVRRLFHVEGLRSLGLSLQEIADVLADLSFDPAAMVEQLISRTQERLRREEQLLGRLTQVQASDAAAWSDVLRTIGLLRGLDADDPSTRLRFALSHAGEATTDARALAEAALNEADPQVAGA
ncbi:MAG: MerR family transcriptional regulator, partial [Propionibacteriaceae bacterium]|nr:MerR family transcriptional regulator [Propionibacteriaceae bacterium]